MVREHRFFFCEAKSFVLCLPCAGNPIPRVPTVPTNEQDPSVTSSEAFAELASQVAVVRLPAIPSERITRHSESGLFDTAIVRIADDAGAMSPTFRKWDSSGGTRLRAGHDAKFRINPALFEYVVRSIIRL
jgi:hypothetical protein